MANAVTEDPTKFDPKTKWVPATLLAVVAVISWTASNWVNNVSARAEATPALQVSVKELGDKMERISGQMELVVGTREDVIKIRSDIDNIKERHAELFSLLETNRAYTNQLAGLMRDRGISVPPPPTTDRRE
jgi:hypothetical protein